MKHTKISDVVAIILIPFIAFIASLFFEPNIFVVTLLFFGLPSLYLISRNPSFLKKKLLFSLLLAVPLSVFVDTLAAFDGAWFIPHSIIPLRLFGVATFEVFLFSFLWILYPVLFYEHFFDRGKNTNRYPKAYRGLLVLCLSLVVIVSILFLLQPSLLVIPYAYPIISLAFVMIPLVLFLYKFPKFLPRFVISGVYFFFVLFLFEIIALKFNLWTFPGEHFIGWVEILGYRFPFEELFFWMMFATPSIFVYYEFFIDDRKL